MFKTKKSLIALLLGGLGIGITEFVMMGLLEDVAADLRISIPAAGHLISAYALGVMVGAPTFVLLAGNTAPKKMLLILMGMFTVFNSVSMVAGSYEILLLSRLLSGLPHGAFFGVGAVVASRLAEKGKEARAISVMFAGLTFANIAGVPLGTYIGHHYHWHYTFALVTLIGLITFAALWLWMPPIENEDQTSRGTQLNFLKTANAWLIIATIAIGSGGLFCWISYIGPLLTKIAYFSEDSVSYILILAGAGMLVGNSFGAWLADRFSPGYTTIALFLSMSLSLMLVYFFSANQIMSLVMTFITGAISFAMIAPIQILIIGTAKGAEMLAAAVSQAAFNLGNALGAFLGGVPIEHGYDYNSPEWVGVAMTLAGAALAYIFVQRNRKSRVNETTEVVPC